MATTLVDNGAFSFACADIVDEIELLDGTTVIDNATVFSFSAPDVSGIVNLSASIEFTVGVGETVTGVRVLRSNLELANATFATTYSFPNGGVFELTDLEFLVS